MLLLDTCALIWLVQGELNESEARPRLREAGEAGALLVSVTSAWEIGLLARGGRVDFHPDPKTWFARATLRPGLRLTPITPDIAIASSQLPGVVHGDPADRLLIATARQLGAAIVTRDRRILDYAARGHVAALRC